MTAVRLSALCGWLLLAGVAVPVGVAHAQASAGAEMPKVLVVDSQRILDESLAAKDVQSQLNAQRDKFQTELSKDEARLHEEEEKLTEDRQHSAGDDYAKEQATLRTDVEAVDHKVQVRRRALDIAFSTAMDQIHSAFMQIVEDIAKERKVKLVMLRQGLVWNDPSLDITDTVLTQLDKKLPKLAVTIPENPAPAVEDENALPMMKFNAGE